MLIYILSIAVLNLGLGFAIALFLQRKECTHRNVNKPQPPSVVQRESTEPQATEPTAADKPVSAVSAPATADCLGDLPETWQADLQSESIRPASLIEATIHFLRIQTSRFLASLTTLEDRARDLATNLDASAVQQLVSELDALSLTWLDHKTDANRMLSKQANSTADGALADQLSGNLADHTALIQDIHARIESLDSNGDILNSSQQMISDVTSLASQAHGFRDRLDDMLAVHLVDSGRLGQLDRMTETGNRCPLPGRVWIELVFHDWWQADPERHRTVTAARIDVDCAGQFNERWGAACGDQVLATLMSQLKTLAEAERGLDHVLPVSGQSCVLFFGDTGPRTATSLVEKFRQTIEHTTFELGDNSFALTVSGAVSDVDTEDTTASIFKKLATAMHEAKVAEGNKTFLNNQGQPLQSNQWSLRLKRNSYPLHRHREALTAKLFPLGQSHSHFARQILDESA